MNFNAPRIAMLFSGLILAAPSLATAATSSETSRLIFASDRDGDFEIYSMEPNGSDLQQLTHNGSEDGFPSWSGALQRIVFRSNRDGNNEIYTMNADGTNQVRYTNNALNDSIPVWSPDGSRIAWHTNRTGNDDVFVGNSSGGGATNLSNTGALEADPGWSPDGGRIAFRRDLGGGNQEIYVMSADGTNQQRITFGPNAIESEPTFSPNNDTIAFTSSRNGPNAIYKMTSSGGSETRLTFDANGSSQPAWSPDGRKVAFHSWREGQDEVYVMDADGSDVTRLTFNGAFDGSVDWAPPYQPGPDPWSAKLVSICCNRGLESGQLTPQQTVVALNTGTETWPAGTTKLGTANPHDRLSSFFDGSWLSENRVALVDSEVLPGETGTFEFQLRAPDSNGASFREYFAPVAEAQGWMDDNSNFQWANAFLDFYVGRKRPPSIHLVEPVPAIGQGQPVPISLSATDNNGLESITVKLGSQTHSSAAPYPGPAHSTQANFNSQGLSPGVHTFSATATDRVGQTATLTDTFEVAPGVSSKRGGKRKSRPRRFVPYYSIEDFSTPGEPSRLHATRIEPRPRGTSFGPGSKLVLLCRFCSVARFEMGFGRIKIPKFTYSPNDPELTSASRIEAQVITGDRGLYTISKLNAEGNLPQRVAGGCLEKKRGRYKHVLCKGRK